MGLFDKFFKKNVPVKEKIFEDYLQKYKRIWFLFVWNM